MSRSAPLPFRAFVDRRLSGSHYRMLAAIAEQNRADVTVTQAGLAAAIGLHLSKVPKIIKTLCELGYVSVTASPSNRSRRTYAIVYGDADENGGVGPTRKGGVAPTRKGGTRARPIEPQVVAVHDAGRGQELAASPTQAATAPAATGTASEGGGPSPETSAELGTPDGGAQSFDDADDPAGTPLPADWPLTMPLRTDAAEARAARNLPPLDEDTEFDSFKRQFVGTEIRRPDWRAAFIEWFATATPPPPVTASSGSNSGDGGYDPFGQE